VHFKRMKPMKQLSLAETGFLPKDAKQAWQVVFLSCGAWSRHERLIDPFCPK
jgi:hypothetical protein